MNGNYAQGGTSALQHLSIDEMVGLADVFQGSYSHVMGNLIGDTKKRMTEFALNVVLRHKPYMLVTPQGFTDMSTRLFGDDETRDFVFTLFFVFSARAGLTIDRYRSLSANLAQSATPVTRGSDLSAAPSAVADRLAAYEEAADLLEANQWLVTLLLLQLFITVELQPAQSR